MNFDFRKLIVPSIILVILAGVIFGILNYSKKPEGEVAPTENTSVEAPVEPNDGLIKSLDPAQDLETDQEKIEISGTAKSRRDTATINGSKVKVDKDGNFKKEITLKEGANEVDVEVTAPDKKKENKKIIVTKKAVGVTAEVPATETPAVSSGTEKGLVPPQEPAAVVAPVPTGDGKGKGTIPEAGPRENAAIAFTMLILALYYWKRSRNIFTKGKKLGIIGR